MIDDISRFRIFMLVRCFVLPLCICLVLNILLSLFLSKILRTSSLYFIRDIVFGAYERHSMYSQFRGIKIILH